MLHISNRENTEIVIYIKNVISLNLCNNNLAGENSCEYVYLEFSLSIKSNIIIYLCYVGLLSLLKESHFLLCKIIPIFFIIL